MKIRLQVINCFVINFTLIVSSFSFYNPLAFAASDDEIIAKQREDCAKNSAQSWSESLNRCVGKIESKTARNAIEDCAKIDDINQRAECHKKIAEEKTGLSANPDNLPGGSLSKSAVMNGAGSAYAILGIINSLKGDKSSTCASKKIFGITAMAGTLTDIWLKTKAKNQIDDLKNKYQIDVKNNSYDAQSKAFVYLKDEQETVNDIAQREKTRNLLLMLGYGSASVMAIYEMTLGAATSENCYKKEEKGKATTGVETFFDNPQGILVMSSIATIYSGMLYKAADAQIDESVANIKKIDRIMAEFKDSYIYYCPQGRDDLSSPDCYCYLDKGGQNNNRSNSKTCQDLWAKNNYKITAIAGNYEGISKFVDPVGCMTLNGQFDEACKCKKFITSNGTNSCMKASAVEIPSGIAQTMISGTGLNDALQLATNSANGNPNFGNFQNGPMVLKAISANGIKKQMLSKLPGGAISGSGISLVDEKNVGKIAHAIFGEKAIAAAMVNSRSPMDFVGSNSTANPALKEAAQKAGLDFSGSGKGLSNKNRDSKLALNLNLSGDSSVAPQMQTFPDSEKSYNYKNNDISKQNGASLFEIITNRYFQSGLKRLFEN